MSFMVLVFGEDVSDSNAIEILVRAINESRPAPIQDIKTKSLREPPILRRETTTIKLKSQAEKIAAFVRSHRANNRVVLAVVHRDCDAVEPSHVRCAQDLRDDLDAAGVSRAVVATPAWEIETWWMQFPHEVNAVRACWASIDYGHANVGMIQNAKERLRRDLRPRTLSRGCPDFKEKDGINIAENVRKRGLQNIAITARSSSFNQFVDDMQNALAS